MHAMSIRRSGELLWQWLNLPTHASEELWCRWLQLGVANDMPWLLLRGRTGCYRIYSSSNTKWRTPHVGAIVMFDTQSRVISNFWRERFFQTQEISFAKVASLHVAGESCIFPAFRLGRNFNEPTLQEIRSKCRSAGVLKEKPFVFCFVLVFTIEKNPNFGRFWAIKGSLQDRIGLV